MEPAIPDTLTNLLLAIWHCLCEPLAATPWADWKGFWLRRVLNGQDNRFVVAFFLPLVPLLLLFPRRHLRAGVIVTGLLFMAYLYGVAFVPFWLVVCAGFYWLSQRYAADLQRKDRIWWSPTWVVFAVLGVWYYATMRLHAIPLPVAWNVWLFRELPWLFPLGARPFSWETTFAFLPLDVADAPPRLTRAMFFAPQTCGLVIFTIRMLHYFAEVRRGTIPAAQRTFVNFLAFNCFAPVFVQGPIERFADFQAGLAHCHDRRRWNDLAAGLGRIALGLGKYLIFVVYWPLPMFPGERDIYLHPEQVQSYAALFFFIHSCVLRVYLVFGGYCDVAIGLARLVGYPAQENFRYFWLARSLTDMWRRWHITLSFILRDYVFMPLVRRRWNVTLNLFVTFLLCGVLHNIDPGYIMWGALMGLMVAVNQKWARWMRDLDRHPQRRLSAVRRAWLKLQPLPKLCAWFVTINSFCLSGLVCLGGVNGFRVLWEIVRRPAVWLAHAWGVA